MSFRDKIAQRISEKDDESFDQLQDDSALNNVEPFVSSRYFGLDNSRNATCIDLRLPDGNRKAIPYAYINEISFNLTDGIEILSTSKKITITGRNLKGLYDCLIGYRVKHIQANIGNDLAEDNVLFVKSILIEEV